MDDEKSLSGFEILPLHIPDKLRTYRGLSPAAKLLYSYLLRVIPSCVSTMPDFEEISASLGICKQDIERLLEDLIIFKLINYDRECHGCTFLHHEWMD